LKNSQEGMGRENQAEPVLVALPSLGEKNDFLLRLIENRSQNLPEEGKNTERPCAGFPERGRKKKGEPDAVSLNPLTESERGVRRKNRVPVALEEKKKKKKNPRLYSSVFDSKKGGRKKKEKDTQ